MGRLMGTGLNKLNIGTSHPGIYAVVGSGAFLGGFTHMTIAIVALLVEACHDLSLTNPTMIGIFVGRLFSQLICPHAYDEMLILAKGVPFLEAELPVGLEGAENTAYSICKLLPEKAQLPKEATVQVLEAALEDDSVMDFPIVDENHVCVGTITRSRLKEALRLHKGEGEERKPKPGLDLRRRKKTNESGTSGESGRSSQSGGQAEYSELGMSKVFVTECQGNTIRISRLMDPTPYTVLQDMPVARFLLLFTKVGIHTAVVMNKYAEFVGLVSKQSLIDATQGAAHGHGSDDHDEHHEGSGAPPGEQAWRAHVEKDQSASSTLDAGHEHSTDDESDASGSQDSQEKFEILTGFRPDHREEKLVAVAPAAGGNDNDNGDGHNNTHSTGPPLPPPSEDPSGGSPLSSSWDNFEEVTPEASRAVASRPPAVPASSLQRVMMTPVDYLMGFATTLPNQFVASIQNCGAFGTTPQRSLRYARESGGSSVDPVVPGALIGAGEPREARPMRTGG